MEFSEHQVNCDEHQRIPLLRYMMHEGPRSGGYEVVISALPYLAQTGYIWYEARY